MNVLEIMELFYQEFPVIIAGPCAIEDEEILKKTAFGIAGKAQFLRGGAFKPRLSPYSFQGLGFEGIDLLQKIGRATNLITVTEVLDTEHVEYISSAIDVIQIGSRNMHNTALLKKIGQTQNPILLKRGLSATIEEWKNAAEYIINEGNENIILCERGIRTFETATRNTLDLNAVALLKLTTDFPVIVDPSHGTGIRELVLPMSLAALSCGANGLMIEVHCNPSIAFCDGEQSLNLKEFDELVSIINKE